MNTNRKIIFFDIDGTILTSRPFSIPKSTVEALKAARAEGHLLFINTGRTYAIIPSYIKELEFDGYVCGCGSQIYMDGQLLHSSTIPNPLCRETIRKLEECRLPAFYECSDRILYNGKSAKIPEPITRMMQDKAICVEDLSLYNDEQLASFTFDKFLAIPEETSDVKGFDTFANEYFNCFVHASEALEYTQNAYSKATGIQFLLDRLGLTLEDSYAIGDGTNDLPMLKYAGTSIAMGNADPAILPYCTYQTTDITDNGIYNALKHFGLIHYEK